MSNEDSESDSRGFVEFEIEDEEEWARTSAGTASHCPFCGYSVVEHIEDEDNTHYCPDCDVKYSVLGVR